MKRVFALLLVSVVCAHCDQIWRIPVNDEVEGKTLLKYEEMSGIEFDYWTTPRIGGYADLVVTNENMKVMADFPLQYDILVGDMQEMFEQRLNVPKNATFHEQYHPLPEIYDFLREKVEQYDNHDGLNVEIFDVGVSTEGRNILGLHFHGIGLNRQKIVFTGGMHAREWIGVTTMTYLMDYLLYGYGQNQQITDLVNAVDWYIIPVLNVDGFSFTHDAGANWRKTRRTWVPPNIGVDPNRNFDFMWGDPVGASPNPASNTYHGPFAASEPEIEQFQRFVLSLGDVRTLIDWHCCGQWVLIPWSWTPVLPECFDEMLEVGNAMEEATAFVNGRRYTVGNSYTILYPTSGDVTDWALGVGNIKYTWTMELPSEGNTDPSQIINIGEESLAGSLELARRIVDEYGGEN